MLVASYIFNPVFVVIFVYFKMCSFGLARLWNILQCISRSLDSDITHNFALLLALGAQCFHSACYVICRIFRASPLGGETFHSQRIFLVFSYSAWRVFEYGKFSTKTLRSRLHLPIAFCCKLPAFFLAFVTNVPFHMRDFLLCLQI